VVHEQIRVFLNGGLRQALGDIYDCLIVLVLPQAREADTDCFRTEGFELAFAVQVAFKLFPEFRKACLCAYRSDKGGNK
ncbi:MAG: hypothetical protein SPK78_08655, partial [Eubacteriales bacterium]|nr:hypothetical protein [Christensenellaceae bacterium]MDY5719542.1 hypothetical protein [Eubacteriales bacterium]